MPFDNRKSSSVGESGAAKGIGAPGAAAAAVDLLTGDDVTVSGEGSSCPADRGSTESHPSSSGSVTSTNTEPLSEWTEDSDNAPASRSPSWQQRKQQQEGQHEKKVAVDQATVAEILQVCRQTQGFLSTAGDGCFGSLRLWGGENFGMA